MTARSSFRGSDKGEDTSGGAEKVATSDVSGTKGNDEAKGPRRHESGPEREEPDPKSDSPKPHGDVMEHAVREAAGIRTKS